MELSDQDSCRLDDNKIYFKKVNFSGIKRPYIGNIDNTKEYTDLNYGGVQNADRIRQYDNNENNQNPLKQSWLHYSGDSFSIDGDKIVQESIFKTIEIYTSVSGDNLYISKRTKRKDLFKKQNSYNSNLSTISSLDKYYIYNESLKIDINPIINTIDVIEETGDDSKDIMLRIEGELNYPQTASIEYIIPNIIKQENDKIPKTSLSFAGTPNGNNNFCPESVYTTSSSIFKINEIKQSTQTIDCKINNSIYIQNQSDIDIDYILSTNYYITPQQVNKETLKEFYHITKTFLPSSNKNVIIGIQNEDCNNEIFLYYVGLQKYRALNINNNKSKLGIQTTIHQKGSPYYIKDSKNDEIDTIFDDKDKNIIGNSLVPEYMIVAQSDDKNDESNGYCYAINYIINGNYSDKSNIMHQSFSFIYDPYMLSAYKGANSYTTDTTNTNKDNYIGLLNFSNQSIRMKQQLIDVPYKYPIKWNAYEGTIDSTISKNKGNYNWLDNGVTTLNKSPENILEYFLPTTLVDDVTHRGTQSAYSYMVKIRNKNKLKRLVKWTQHLKTIYLMIKMILV